MQTCLRFWNKLQRPWADTGKQLMTPICLSHSLLGGFVLMSQEIIFLRERNSVKLLNKVDLLLDICCLTLLIEQSPELF